LRIEQAILWEYNGFLNRWVVVSGPITSADIEPTIVVRPQQAFRICVRVRNAGGAPAGAFRASGSRLGIWPTPQPFSGLLANQVSEGCVAYPHAPSRPGEYRAIITVDSQQQVSESREDNNAMSVAVRVVQ
jgi:subtilase family serine protease